MKDLHLGTASGKALNHAICDGPIIVAHVLGQGYPAGIGWSRESEDTARVLAASYDLYEALQAAEIALLDFAKKGYPVNVLIRDVQAALEKAGRSHEPLRSL